MAASRNLDQPARPEEAANPRKAAGRPLIFLVSHSSAGGAQEIWSNLAEGFRDRGYDVQLMALYPFRSTVRETAAGLSWSYVVPERPKNPLAMLKMLRSLVAKLRSEEPAIVFTAMPAANVMAPIAAKLAGGSTKVVISHHSPAETHNPILNRVDGLMGSLSSTKAVVSVSNAVSSSLDRKPKAYRVKRKTIHNALPPRIEGLLADLAAQQAPRVARSRTVVATGRLAPQKNYPLLVRAAAHMKDVQIRVTGNGPLEAMLNDLAHKEGVDDRVHFLGHRPREEAMSVLASGDVFVQVSLFEGHSLGLIEAAKLGLPLVVSDVPVQIEGVTAKDGTRCGITVSPTDDVGLAREIMRLLDDPQHYALWAERARKLGEEATYAAMIEAYEELVRSA